MTGISLSPFTAETRDTVLRQLLAAQGLQGAVAHIAPGGKPYLERFGKSHGLAISHLRKGPRPVSLMAVCADPHIGIDAEFWPPAPTDETLLQTVTAAEDEAIAMSFTACGRDAAILLWSIKEAALKASGNVMHEPAELAVQHLGPDEFAVTNSLKSSAPIPHAVVRCWRFASQENEQNGLVCVAFSALNASLASRQDWHLDAPHLRLVPALHLTKD